MNNKPIGIFDSGVGGLTVAREIMDLMPNESIIYLGDTANLPYGDKSKEIIKKYAIANAEFLLKFDIKVLVVACNTASSVALKYLKENYDIPIIGVIEPAAKGALYATRDHKIGVIGTNRTIKSDVYANVIKTMSVQAKTYSKSCSLFVPLIEEDFIEHEATRLIAMEYLDEFKDIGIDCMILGCTHYPLLKDLISDILPGVKLVDSAESTSKDLLSILDTDRILNQGNVKPKHRFFATDITDKLNDLALRILGVKTEFEEVELS